MARTFQNIRLFGNMTALENVMVGRYCRTSAMALTSILRGPKFRARRRPPESVRPGACSTTSG
jgi:branched-chain amino acid transport system ATP-binding protein